MSPLQIALIGVRALLRNKMRSFLTTLGIIIGVGAVIAMTAIGAGARARIEQTFESMGSNMLMVRSGASMMRGMRGAAGSQPTLTWGDLDAIRDEVSGVSHVAPVLSTAAQVQAEGQNWSTGIQGTTPEYFSIRNWATKKGAWFTGADIAGGTKVAVLGQTVVTNLFGAHADPVGETVRINNVPFEVIGVAADKGTNAFGSDNDDVVFVPSTTFRAKLQGGLEQFIPGQIVVGTASREATDRAQKEIEALLRVRHRLRPGQPDDFSVRNLADIASARQEGTRTMTSLLAGIALVSLVVGGIGIMNIMLVSVTERTREIGLRMAVGAKPRDIQMQFLIEAVTLSLLGGVFGVLLGLGVAFYLVAQFDWPMLVQPSMVALAVAFSAVVGVGFGIYPAQRASRLDPIQALRYE